MTRVGDNGLFMVNAHIGHDVRIGNGALISNNVMIAGHVVCENNVAIMGGVGIHHFVTVGEGAYIAGYARIHCDVPPFCKVDGADIVRGLNKKGLERAGYSPIDIEALGRSLPTPLRQAQAHGRRHGRIRPAERRQPLRQASHRIPPSPLDRQAWAVFGDVEVAVALASWIAREPPWRLAAHLLFAPVADCSQAGVG